MNLRSMGLLWGLVSGASLAQPLNAPPIPAPKAWAAPTPKSAPLSNGARLWVHSSTGLPLVHIVVAVNAGSLADPAGKAGLAMLTASAVEEGGAGARSPNEVLDAFDALGTSLEVAARDEGVIFATSVLSSKLDQALPLLFDLLARARFDATAFESVKQRQLAQIAADLDEPRAVATKHMVSMLFGDSARGHQETGTTESVKALTIEDVKAFYAAHYLPAEVTIAISGEVSVEAAQKMINAASPKPWSTVSAPARAAEAASPTVKWVGIDKPGAAQTVLAVARPGFAAGVPNVTALQTVSTVLGGTFTSRLVQRLREKSGYTYGIRSRLDTGRYSGVVSIRTSVRTDVTAPAIEQIFEEMKGLSTFSAADKDKGFALLRTQVVDAFGTGREASEAFATLALLGLPPNFYAQQSGRLAAVTPEQLAAATTVFAPEAFSVVLVGDRAKIEKDLKAKFPTQVIEWRAP